jgi:PAS domain S-box-containing protein
MVDQIWTMGQGIPKSAEKTKPKAREGLLASKSAVLPTTLVLLGALYMGSLLALAVTLFVRSDDAVHRISKAEQLHTIAMNLSSTIKIITAAEVRYAKGNSHIILDEMHGAIRLAQDLIDDSLSIEANTENRRLLELVRTEIELRHEAIDKRMNSTNDAPMPVVLPSPDLLQAPTIAMERRVNDALQQAHIDYEAASGRLRTIFILAFLGIFACSVTQIFLHRRRINELSESRNALADANRDLKAAFKASDQKLFHVEKLFSTTLSATKMTMFIQNTDLVISWIHNPQFGSAAELIGKRDPDFMPIEAARQTVKVKKQVIASGIGQQFEYSYSKAGKMIHKWIQVDPILDNGSVIGLIGVAIDVTERHLRETQIEALASELVHRNQNMLAVISSMSRRLFRTSDSMAEFESRFDSRLQAISRSFDVIVREEWEGAQLDVLIKAQLESVASGLSDRVAMTGQALFVSPHFVETIGSAIHELAQNALTHGALSNASGRVSIDWWTQTDLFNTQTLSFVWRENDGSDHVPVISHRGYGMNILEKIVPQALNGKVNVTLKPGGFSWYLSCPWLTQNEVCAQRLIEPMTEKTTMQDRQMTARDIQQPDSTYAIERKY